MYQSTKRFQKWDIYRSLEKYEFRFTLFNFYHREANSDGRASGFVTWEQFEPVVYKMKFDIKEYFQSRNISTFYPYAEVS